MENNKKLGMKNYSFQEIMELMDDEQRFAFIQQMYKKYNNHSFNTCVSITTFILCFVENNPN